MVVWNRKTHSTQDNTAGFTKGQKGRVSNLSREARSKGKVVDSKNKATNQQGNKKPR